MRERAFTVEQRVTGSRAVLDRGHGVRPVLLSAKD